MAKHNRRRKAPQPKQVQPADGRSARPSRRWKMIVGGTLAFAGLSVGLVAYAVRKPSPPSGTGADYEIINTYPHDPYAFTQGFEYHDGHFYEGTGQRGQSSVRKVEVETGKVVRIEELDGRYFGEGLTIWNDKIVQLTWESNTGFVRDLETFAALKEFRYSGEGWGLTHDDKRLIMSDGTARLRFIDPETLEITDSITVKDHERRITRLNELEMVGDEIYANVWETEHIVRISPSTGQVLGWINLRGLRSRAFNAVNRRPGAEDVLNGIAYDAKNDRLFVTGKNWPRVFEIRVTEKP